MAKWKWMIGCLGVLAFVGTASATVGYVNDCSDLTDFSNRPGVGAPVSDPYLSYGGEAVSWDIEGEGTYAYMDVRPRPGFETGDPTILINGQFTIQIRIDSEFSGTDPGFVWMRVYSGTWDGENWNFIGERYTYGLEIPVNDGWQTFTFPLYPPDEYYNGNPLDPEWVYAFRLDDVTNYDQWGPLYTVTLDHFECAADAPVGERPVADGSNSDSNIPPDGIVTLDGSLSTDDGSIARYIWWKDDAIVADVTTPVTEVEVEPGQTHNFRLWVFDDDGRRSLTYDEVTIIPSGQPPVADTTGTATLVDPAGLVILDGSLSSDPDGTVERWIWSVDGEPIADIAAPVTGVYLDPDSVTTVTLTVVDNEGIESQNDPTVDITVGSCTGVEVGYDNDYANAYGVLGDFPVILEDGGTKMPLTSLQSFGYKGYKISTPCGLDLTGGAWSIDLYIDNPGGELSDVGWWLRMYDANGKRAGWFALSETEDFGQWVTFNYCVSEPDPDPGATDPDFDPSHVVWMRVEAVVWANAAYTSGIRNSYIEIPDSFPTADAGPDQDISDGVCGPNSVTLDGTASVGAFSYKWWLLGEVVAETAIANLDLPPGEHYFTLEVADETGCAKDYDEVVVNIYNDGLGIPLEPPVDIPMDAQINNGLGDVIYTPTGDDLNAFWAAGDFTDNYIGEDPGGNSIDHTIALIIPGGGWYYGPQIDLLAACYGAVDMSGDGAQVEFEAAYVFPPPPGEDHPIGLTLFDAYGNRRFFGMYQNADTWESRLHTMDVYDTNVDFSDEAFDPSLVVKAQFWGTNWNGTGQSYLQLRNFLMTPGTSPLCAGDMDCDGDIDFDDIAPFVAAIGADPDTWEQQFNCLWLNGDTDGDLDVDFDDIAPFVSLIGTQCD